MREASWVEPEKVDEGLEATTTAPSDCIDWSVYHFLHLTLCGDQSYIYIIHTQVSLQNLEARMSFTEA